MGNEGYVKSRWNIGEYEWEIHIYPATRSTPPGSVLGRASDTKWVAVALKLLSDIFKCRVRATLDCRLVDPRGMLKPSEERSVSGTFAIASPSHSVVLMETRDLAASGYLIGDSLTVQCKITVLKELPAATIPVKEVPAPSSNLHQHLAGLLQSLTAADVTFLVSGGESFAAHKLILAARSPVFMAQFFGDMREKRSRCVEVKDKEASAFKAMLHFIYTDTVPELDQKLQEATTMAQHLLAAADRYGLDRLKLICEGKLTGGINVETAATTLALAQQRNCSQLKAKCVEFILRTPANTVAVLATEGYKHLEASCPLVLIELLRSSARGRNN